jgi:hypothetical protein
MTKKITIILLMVSTVTAGVFAHDLKGKDIAETGKIVIVKGVLNLEDNELYLKTDDTIYTIHLGPEWYAEEIGFPKSSGESATVEGFAVAEDIAPLTIVVRGKTYTFRDEDGAPAWAGIRRNQSRDNNWRS